MRPRLPALLAAVLSAGLLQAAPRRPAVQLETPSGSVAREEGEGSSSPAYSGESILALAALDRRIADLDTEETTTRKNLALASGELAAVRARDIARGRTFYKLTRAGMLPLSGGFEALVGHAMRVERARRLLESGLASEAHLRERAASFGSTLERVTKDRSALASQRTAMDAARMALADEGRRARAFAHAFESSGGAPGEEFSPVHGPADDDVGAPRGFGAARGKLLFPIEERVDVRPAKRDGADGPGLEIQAKLGAKVRAVYAGRVAFADRYGGYGRIVILDHGDHFYSVSGNLGSIDVKIGDEVGAGDRIGAVGDEGAGALLYFEVRHGSTTVAPAPWLGL